MQVNPERVQAVFLAAVEEESAVERGAVLDRECGDDAELRQRVEALLHAHDAPGAFLESHDIDLSDTAEEPLNQRSGTTIGSYKLLEQLGEGGFGVVFLAEQTQPVRRHVALKILKPGMDTRQVVARFEAERQALAIMDHPHIAKVFDGGATHSGRPYFVMELVRGVPITEFCDQQHLTPRQRLELFISVCLAVQHAHQKGIIHRDLKPSNVLVAVHDTTPLGGEGRVRGMVKVIDFGIAKALGQELTDKTMFTASAHMIGTPLYMSPEQAGQSGLDIDTRSDIYSLGVLLYELLTGTTPFSKERLRQAGFDEMRRIIREEDPPRPSTRLLESKDSLASISAQRHTEPATLTKLVRGELDWIVMKCLEKDRNLRYETASALAADVQRFLADEPVQAGPPSAGYRLRKFVKRHRSAVLAATLVLLALLVGTVGTAFGLVEARSQWDLAEEARGNEAEQRKAATKSADEAKAGREKAQQLAKDEKATREKAQQLAKDEKAARDRAEKELLRAEWLLYASRISQAQQAWESHNLVLALHYLNSCRADFRGWEHEYFTALFRGSQHITLRGHTDTVTCIAMSADGKRIVSGCKDGTMRVWNVDTRQSILTIRGRAPAVSKVAMSADGTRIVCANHPVASMTIFNAVTGQEIRTLKVEANTWITDMALSGDGKHLASGCGDGTVQTWDVDKGARTLNIKAHSTAGGALGDDVYVALSADGTRIVSTGRRGKLSKVWDATKAKEIVVLNNAVEVFSMALSGDGKRIVCGGGDGSITVWDIATGQKSLNIKAHRDIIVSLAQSADDRRIVSGSFDMTARVWDAGTGQEIRTFKGHEAYVNGVAVSADGQRIVSASSDRTIKVWDTTTPEEAPILKPAGEFPFRNIAALSPNGKAIATVSYDGALDVWDAATGQVTRAIKKEGAGNRLVTSLAFSPDSNRLIGNYDSAVRVWDAATGKVLRDLKGHTHPIMQVAQLPADRLVSASKDGTVKVWDEFGGVETRTLDGYRGTPGKVHVECLAVSPDGKHVGGGWSDGTVQVWDAATGKVTMSAKGHRAIVNSVAMSPDGKSMLSGSSDGTVKVWDVVTGVELRTLRGHTEGVFQVAWLPNGKRIISCSTLDRNVKIWDAASGFETLTLKGMFLAVSPDSKRILYVHADGTLKLWDASRSPQ